MFHDQTSTWTVSVVCCILCMVLVSSARAQLNVTANSSQATSFGKNHYECDFFLELPSSLCVDGDFTLITGFSMTPQACQNSCLKHTAVTFCAVANLQKEGICILSGYRLTRLERAQHYRRVCPRGRQCFQRFNDYEANFHTGFIAVPEVAKTTDYVMTDFCRRECESMEDCIGFDVQLGLDYCPYSSFRTLPHDMFDTYERTCLSFELLEDEPQESSEEDVAL